MPFVLLRPIWCEKWKIAPPPFENSPPSNVWICEIGRNSSLNFGEDLFFFFFWRSPNFRKNLWISDFGRKITLNFGEDLFFLFGDHPISEKTFEFRISAEKSLWILAKTFFFFFYLEITQFQKKPLNFGFRPKNHSEFWRRPFFFFFFFFFGDHPALGGKKLWISDLSETFRLKFRTNRLKLIQNQWKFESRSFAHFSLFQNSPPFSKSWLRAWLQVHCNLIAALLLHLTTLIDLTSFFVFFFRLTICPVVNFVLLHRDENSYLLFHPRFA